MSNTARAYSENVFLDCEDEDSWKHPVRMLYRVQIEIRKPGEQAAIRKFSFQVPNFHNAEAIQRAFFGVSTVTVSFEPDVFAYLQLRRTRDF